MSSLQISKTFAEKLSSTMDQPGKTTPAANSRCARYKMTENGAND